MAATGGHWSKSRGGALIFRDAGGTVAGLAGQAASAGASYEAMSKRYDQLSARHNKITDRWDSMTVAEQWAAKDQADELERQMKALWRRMQARQGPTKTSLERAKEEYRRARAAHDRAGWAPSDAVVKRYHKAMDALRKARQAAGQGS